MISLDDIPKNIGSARYLVTYGGAGIQRFIEEYREDGGIDMDPDFQRGHVWTDAMRVRFVEHLLRGGEHGRTIVWNTPIQDAVTYADTPDRDLPTTLVLVDGKQRLTALLSFLNDDLKVFDGNAFSDFDEKSRRYMMTAAGPFQMRMHVHSLQYRRDLLRLYLELNEGAVAHAETEIERVRELFVEAGGRT